MRRMIVPLMLAAVAACQPQAGPLSDADAAAIESVAVALDRAALAHDWDQMFTLFTDDAVSMAQGYPALDGRVAMQAAVEEAMASLTVTGHTIVFQEIEGLGNLAYATGTYAETYAVAGVDQPIEVNGRVLVILRKQQDGNWRITVWSTNTES